MFLSLVLQDYRIPVCAQLLVMIVIAGRLSLLGFVFKPVSWLAGDSRLRQTFSQRQQVYRRSYCIFVRQELTCYINETTQGALFHLLSCADRISHRAVVPVPGKSSYQQASLPFQKNWYLEYFLPFSPSLIWCLQVSGIDSISENFNQLGIVFTLRIRFSPINRFQYQQY